MGTLAAAVVEKNEHQLTYYDIESGARLRRVALDPYPHEFARSPDGAHVFCTHFGVALAEDEGPGGNSVSVVDLARGERLRRLDCGPWRRPHGVAVDGHGKLYVASEGESRLLVWDDPFEGEFIQDQPTGGAGSHILSVTSDGRWVFSSNMKSHDLTILDTEDPERPPKALATGERPEGSVLSADESRLYVVNRESSSITVVDVAAQDVAGEIATPAGPVRIARDSEGRLLVALYHARGLARIDPSAPERSQLLPLPAGPVSVGYAPEQEVALLSTLGDELCVVDLDAWALKTRIATGSGPDPALIVSLD